MTPNDIAAAAERVAYNQSISCQSFPDDYMILALAYIAEKRKRDLTFQVNEWSRIERAVMSSDTTGGPWPDWVYEARAAVKHMGENPPPWLADLHAILGWQGGTVHAALKAVQRLVAIEDERVKKRDAEAAKQKFADFLDNRYEGYRPRRERPDGGTQVTARKPQCDCYALCRSNCACGCDSWPEDKLVRIAAHNRLLRDALLLASAALPPGSRERREAVAALMATEPTESEK